MGGKVSRFAICVLVSAPSFEDTKSPLIYILNRYILIVLIPTLVSAQYYNEIGSLCGSFYLHIQPVKHMSNSEIYIHIKIYTSNPKYE